MPSLPKLLIPKQELKATLTVQIEKANSALTNEKEVELKGIEAATKRFREWDKYNKTTLKESFENNEVVREYDSISVEQLEEGSDRKAIVARHNHLISQKKRWLDNFLKKRLNLHKEQVQYIPTIQLVKNDDLIINRICTRFHTIVRQLRQRHEDRSTLDVKDEYDAQDLLHALLRLHFDDIREEEWSPSYAGGASRVDFLLKKEQIIIEVKKTRPSLKARQLGADLIVDIARYQAHPDCKMLYCFVYDPDGYIANPRGIENDLSRTEKNLERLSLACE